MRKPACWVPPSTGEPRRSRCRVVVIATALRAHLSTPAAARMAHIDEDITMEVVILEPDILGIFSFPGQTKVTLGKAG